MSISWVCWINYGTANIVEYYGMINKVDGVLHLLTQRGIHSIMLRKNADGRTVWYNFEKSGRDPLQCVGWEENLTFFIFYVIDFLQ